MNNNKRLLQNTYFVILERSEGYLITLYAVRKDSSFHSE